MLSYRHAFHAGSFADVLKHAVLVHALRHAVQKPKPLYFLDTHAGAGSYDLERPMARKTGEFRAGIEPVLQAEAPPPLLRPYLDLARTANPPGVLRSYLGSPAFARALLRSEDRIELIELHGTDHEALADWAGPRLMVRREDGLAALHRRMPPPERRAVVLVDPSYELKTDYQDVVVALAAAHRRFPTGIYLLWYPVIDRARTEAMLAGLAATGIPRQLRIELCPRPDAPGRGMTGCGMVVINPPWTLAEAADAALPWLAQALGTSGPSKVDWLTPPS
jgi:23S rRNA (adenine2030-N6)-methyltransferase